MREAKRYSGRRFLLWVLIATGLLNIVAKLMRPGPQLSAPEHVRIAFWAVVCAGVAAYLLISKRRKSA